MTVISKFTAHELEGFVSYKYTIHLHDSDPKQTLQTISSAQQTGGTICRVCCLVFRCSKQTIVNIFIAETCISYKKSIFYF